MYLLNDFLNNRIPLLQPCVESVGTWYHRELNEPCYAAKKHSVSSATLETTFVKSECPMHLNC